MTPHKDLAYLGGGAVGACLRFMYAPLACFANVCFWYVAFCFSGGVHNFGLMKSLMGVLYVHVNPCNVSASGC